MSQDNRMFLEMKKAAWERLKSCRTEEIVKKAGVIFEEKESAFYLNSFGGRVSVTYPGFQVKDAVTAAAILLDVLNISCERSMKL